MTRPLAVIAILAIASPAFAVGEVFQLGTKGVEYCKNPDEIIKLSSKNAIPLWGRIDSDDQITVSLDSQFDPARSFSVPVRAHQTGKSVVFIGGDVMVFADLSVGMMAIQAKAKIDKNTGELKSIKARFIESGMFFADCDSAGTLSGKR